MRRLRVNKKIALLFIALAAVLVFAPNFVGALEGTEGRTETQRTTEAEDKTETSDDNLTNSVTKTNDLRREERKDVARERLSEVKRRVCAKREARINTIMDRVVLRSQGHIDRITAIADKTKAFYGTRGNISDVYTGLVANVEVARQSAQTAVDLLSSDAVFSCDTDGPKSDIQEFRNQRQTKTTAVGAYRSSVKELIVAVKTAQSNMTKEQQ